MSSSTTDPFNLARFIDAQAPIYSTVLAELRAGRKRTHWMWFIFPQFAGLGSSAMAQRYAIGSLDEARAYLHHPTLGARLHECTRALLAHADRDMESILGDVDAQKAHSSATLFALVAPEDSVFAQLLAKFFKGDLDPSTLRLAEK